MYKTLLFSIVCIFTQYSFAQVGIGTDSPETSAILDVNSQTKGFLPPRMSTTDRTSINGGDFAEGLVIYNTDDKCINFYNGMDWINLCSPVTTTPLPDFTNSTCYTPLDGAANDRFGVDANFSADGTRLIVGSYHNDSKKGSAYVYRLDGTNWIEESQITAADGAADDRFGSHAKLSADGATALIGAPGDDSEKGSAYISTRTSTSWSVPIKLVAGDGVTKDSYGVGNAMTPDGNTVVIGAYAGANPTQGAAYVYTRNGTSWPLKQKLVASDGPSQNNFGSWTAISADGNVIVVGAQYRNTGQGAAYVFIHDGIKWKEEQILTASGSAPGSGDYFGNSVCISEDGSTIIVSAIENDGSKGAVYVYTRTGNTWGNEVKLVPADAVASDLFGATTALSADGTALVAGALNPDGLGYAYIYEFDGTDWNEHKKLTEASLTGEEFYGISVAIAANKSKISVGAMLINSSQGNICVYD